MTASRPNRRQTAADKRRAEIALAESTVASAKRYLEKYPESDQYYGRFVKIASDWTDKANEYRARLAQLTA
jgi:hypothetical protein